MLRIRNGADSLEGENVETQRVTGDLVTVAETVAAEIQKVQHTRDDAAVAAFVEGGQVAAMRECLAGINRALNLVSVGDPHSVDSLAQVRTQCRSVGA